MTTSANAPNTSESSDRLADFYPHLGEVLETYCDKQKLFEEPDSGFVWIRKACRLLGTPSSFLHSYLAEWDTLVSLLDSEAKEAVARRFEATLPKRFGQWRDAYNDAFLEAIVELMGLAWLIKNGHKEVRFVPPSSVRQPDIMTAGSVVMECKHIRSSDYERDYFKNHQLEARSVNPWAVENLAFKCERTIDAAMGQYVNYPFPEWRRFMFMDIAPDTMVRLHEDENPEVISSFVVDLNSYAEERGLTLILTKFLSLTNQMWP